MEKEKARIPKKRKFKRRQKRQLALLTFIVLVASVCAIMLLTPGFNIKKINVNGNSVVKDAEIIRAAGLATGVNIFEVSLSEAEKRVKEMGYIEKVKIKRKLPSTVEITVVEEVGVAYFKTEKGYVIITADGRCVEVTDGITKDKENNNNTAKLPELPLIRGISDVKYKMGEIITAENTLQLKRLFECLHEFSRKGYVFNMREIDMSNPNDIKFYYLTKELCVSVGDGSKIGYKMECFGPVLRELGTDPKGYIDLGNVAESDKIVYREPTVETEKTE